MRESLPSRVTVCQVGPRDGLQNEAFYVSTQAKIHFVDLLTAAGMPIIEATSFVRAESIPQLGEAEHVLAGLSLGLSTFDSSAGGLGGCPYAPGAAGNVATEDLVYMLHGMGIETGISLDHVVAASHYLSTVTRRMPASRYYAAANS